MLHCIQQPELKRVADQSQVHVLSESRRVRFSTRVGSLTECASGSIMLMPLIPTELVDKVMFRGCVSPDDFAFIIHSEKMDFMLERGSWLKGLQRCALQTICAAF